MGSVLSLAFALVYSLNIPQSINKNTRQLNPIKVQSTLQWMSTEKHHVRAFFFS